MRIRPPTESVVSEGTDAVLAALRAADLGVAELTEDGRVTLFVDGRGLRVEIVPVAYCTGQRARDLIRRRTAPRAGMARLVVSDRITTEARALLSEAGWSWLDRRGRMHLHGPGVRVDIDVPGHDRASTSAESVSPVTGRGAVTVAYWLCDHPGESLSPTKSAPLLGLAPSTVSTAVRRLRAAGLVEDDGAGVFPELFWELASAWRPERTWLLAAPDPAGHGDPDPDAPRWCRTGTAAAAAYGAPVVTTEGGPVELYVPGPVEISIAVRRYGAAPPGVGAAVIAVAPVTAVTAAHGETPVLDDWPLAPMLAVALDLAQDRARGREILEGWDTDGSVWR